jgi:hypothetical protein
VVTYQIISFNQETGSIEVCYRLDNEIVGIYNIDLDITEDNKFITGTELEDRIMSQYPSWVVERATKLKSGISNSAEIAAMVIPLPVPTPDTEQPISTGTQTL